MTEPASKWKTGSGTVDVASGALVGILNVTPDSFSDGGEHDDPDEAIAAGLRMVADGARLVDVGGESTRPGAASVDADEELARVLPVLEGLVHHRVPVSIDTSKPEVAAAAISAGASVVNDVTGFRSPDMVRVVAESGVGVVILHMSGEPRTMQDEPWYDDVVQDVSRFLERQAETLIRAGVGPESIAVDPGIGFGKTAVHNLELIGRLSELCRLGYPVLIGTSRKSTLGKITGEADPRARDGHTAITTALAYERGARLFRVHNVAASRDALRIVGAIVAPHRWDEWQQD